MDAVGALTDADLTALRRAAALAHTVGALTLRLRVGGTNGPVAATVVPRSLDRHEMFAHPAGVVLDPCGFRSAVARAWADERAGCRVGFAATPGQAGPLELEWAIDPPGDLLGFGAVRRASAGRMVWATVSLCPPAELRGLLGVLDDSITELTGRPAHTDDLEARIVSDDLLGVSVVHVEAKSWMPAMIPVLDEAMRRLVAAVGAAEIVGPGTAAPADPPPRVPIDGSATHR